MPNSLGYRTHLERLYLAQNKFSPAWQKLIEPMTLLENKEMDSSTEQRYKCYMMRLLGHLRDEYDLLARQKSTNKSLVSNLLKSKVLHVYHYKPSKRTLLPNNDKRAKVLNEILETEITYVKELVTMYKLYYQKMLRSGILGTFQLSAIFANLELIMKLHRDYILPHLREAVEEGGISIGHLFACIDTSLECYSTYINHNDISNALLAWLAAPERSSTRFVYPEKSDQFHFAPFEMDMHPETVQRILELFERVMEHEEHTQINLFSYLILPVQRLPRYVMLLDSLLKQTELEHPDYERLKTACGLMHDRVMWCNEQKRIFEVSFAQTDILCKVRKTSTSLGLNYLQNTPPGRLFLCKSEMNDLRLVKYVELAKMLNPALFTKSCTLENYGMHEYKFKYKPTAKIEQEIESGGATSRYDVACTSGKKISLLMFNDMVLLTIKKRENFLLIRCIALYARGKQAEVMPVSGSEGVLRLTDGYCVVYLRGEMECLWAWASRINTCRRE